MIFRPWLTDDPAHNRRTLQAALDTTPAGKLELPPGTHRVEGGLRVPGGWTVRGAETIAAGGGPPGTWLESVGTGGDPVLHVLGSGVTISDLGLRPPPADPGEHGGDRGTAITVGRYLYPSAPEWIDDVDIRRVRIERTTASDRAANSVALMGAVRGVRLHDITVRGGYTGLAVHWGAVGAGVSSIVGPTYHPHRLDVSDLRVDDAVEGFYLSSVHDVRVNGACLRAVEMGFRLLPGDNTNRFAPHGSPAIGARIEISDVCTRWTGDKYGVRVAGWGRSEVDGLVSVLRYTETVIRDCTVVRVRPTTAHPPVPAPPGGTWSPIVIERADGVDLHNIQVGTLTSPPATCCSLHRRPQPASAG